jgi:peptidoglycan/LPS O-acetylase OafA/YrhL
VNRVNPSYQSNYRPEIDGLRAVAVLSVVAYHAFPGWLAGGFTGVDVFFVISGFLITGHIFESLDKGSFSFAGFFGRRIRRIFPALIIVMAASLAFGWLVLLPDELAQLGKHVASGAAFVLNIVLAYESGYFDNAAETKPMLHLWSLSVEEQFYIIWPLVLWLAWKLRISLLLVTIAAAAVSFYINLHFVDQRPAQIFFWPVGRFWELLAGSILAWVMLYRKDLLPGRLNAGNAFVANGLSILGLALLVFGFIRIDEALPFPSAWALVPVSGALLVIAAGPEALLNRLVLMNPVAVWFGLISYPLYLWHWPILSFLRIVDGKEPDGPDRMIAVAASILLAWITYRFVEMPIRFGGNRKRKALLLAGVLIIAGLTGWVVKQYGGITGYNAQFLYITQAKEDWAYPDGLISAGIDGQEIWSTGPARSKLLFAGDSHMAQYGPRIVDLYRRGKIPEARFVTSSGCPLVPGVFAEKRPECRTFMDGFRAALSANDVETIVIGVCFNCYFIETGSSPYHFQDGDRKLPLSGPEGLRAAKESFYRFVGELAERYRVVVLMDVPKDVRFAPSHMLSTLDGGRRPIPLQGTPVSVPFDQDPRQIDLETELASGLADTGATVIRQSPVICPSGVCDPLSGDGRPKYKDADHMRPYFVREHMDLIDAFIVNE